MFNLRKMNLDFIANLSMDAIVVSLAIAYYVNNFM
jgi:hypothetical protein